MRLKRQIPHNLMEYWLIISTAGLDMGSMSTDSRGWHIWPNSETTNWSYVSPLKHLITYVFLKKQSEEMVLQCNSLVKSIHLHFSLKILTPLCFFLYLFQRLRSVLFCPYVHKASMFVSPATHFCEPQQLYSPMQVMSECVNIMLPAIAADTVHTGEFTPVMNCSGVHLQPAHQFKRTIVRLLSSHSQSQTAFKPNLPNPNKPRQRGILQSLS